MTARLTAAGLLVAATLAAVPAAHGAPVHEDPGTGTATDSVASLLQELRLDYAATHQRGVHNEIVLVLHHPAAAFL